MLLYAHCINYVELKLCFMLTGLSIMYGGVYREGYYSECSLIKDVETLVMSRSLLVTLHEANKMEKRKSLALIYEYCCCCTAICIQNILLSNDYK